MTNEMPAPFSKTTTILVSRVSSALEMLKKFEKKAVRYNVPFSWTVGETYEIEKDYHDPNGIRPPRKIKVAVVDVTIHGEQPKVGDFDFLASIEFAPGGNFVDVVPGVELPAIYRTTDQHCDHCKTDRRRNNVYIVKNRETGALVQVGRTCLRDFLGIDDPKSIIEKFKFLRAIKSFSDDEDFEGWGGGHYWAAEIQRALAISNVCVRLWGWVSKGAAYNDPNLVPTVNFYWGFVAKRDEWNAEMQDRINDELGDADYDFADKVIEFVRANTDDNDYMHNLRVAFHEDVITEPKRMGLVVSAVVAYHRHIDREIKRAERRELNKDSRHQGEVKERLRGIKVRLEARRGMGDNGYGWSELLKMRDDQGNLYAWFSTSAPVIDVNNNFVIDGTVKAHKEFKGILETQLTRVKIVGG